MPVAASCCLGSSTPMRIRYSQVTEPMSLKNGPRRHLSGNRPEVAVSSRQCATRAANADELFESGKRYAHWFLRCGTTTVEAKSGYGLTLDDELKSRTIKQLDQDLPLRYVPTFLGAHDIPSEFSQSRDKYVALVIEEMLRRGARRTGGIL